MRNMLIIQAKKFMSKEVLQKERDRIIKERESGVIIIDACCDVLVVPEDIEIKVKGEEDGTI